MIKLLRYSSIFTFIFLLSVFTSCSQTNNTKQNTLKSNNPTRLDENRRAYWENLPKSVGYVNDFENLYTKEQISSLDSIIAAFEAKTTIQIAVVTLDTMNVAKDKFEDFTLRLANNWAVGQKDKNNGILIGISRGYRKIRIQNGDGIVKLISDNETKTIIDDAFIPGFKEGNYYKGTLNGVTKFIDLLNNKLKQ